MEEIKDTDALHKMGLSQDQLRGLTDSHLPPIPSSDPMSLEKNKYDSFYRTRARDFWGDAEVISNEVKDFVKCVHYVVKENNEVRCTKCHVGWIVPDSFHTENGKLYENEVELQFAL
jgi:hypothetical protein